MLKNATEIKESPKKLDVPSIIQECIPQPKLIILDLLPNLEIYDKVI